MHVHTPHAPKHSARITWRPYETARFALRDESVIPALREAVAAGGMRVGGVRRVLVPPKASVGYPYVPIPADQAARTKFGFAPAYPPSLGEASLRATPQLLTPNSEIETLTLSLHSPWANHYTSGFNR